MMKSMGTRTGRFMGLIVRTSYGNIWQRTIRSDQLHLAHDAYVNLFHRTLDWTSLLYLKRKMPARETLLWLRHNAFAWRTITRLTLQWGESSEVMAAGRRGLEIGTIRWQPWASRHG